MATELISESERRQVASIIRETLRTGYPPTFAPQHLTRFVKANDLLRQEWWPGYHVKLTDRGAEFLAEAEDFAVTDPAAEAAVAADLAHADAPQVMRRGGF